MSKTPDELNLCAMFTDTDQIYFGTASENSGADLELKRTISLFQTIFHFILFSYFNDVLIIDRER